MQYLKLDAGQREELWNSLCVMPAYLHEIFSNVTADQARMPGPDGTFSPVEQIWHLADLEREGFGERIRKLLSESQPYLPDFDGTARARERDYRSLPLEEGLREFTAARAQNLSTLQGLAASDWSRRGTQEGVGEVAICDIPGFMAQHDTSHRIEIETWKNHILV